MRRLTMVTALFVLGITASASADTIQWMIPSSPVTTGQEVTFVVNSTAGSVTGLEIIPARGTAGSPRDILGETQLDATTGTFTWKVSVPAGIYVLRVTTQQDSKSTTLVVEDAPVAQAVPAPQPVAETPPPPTPTPTPTPTVTADPVLSRGQAACRPTSLRVWWKVHPSERGLYRSGRVVRAPRGARVVVRLRVIGAGCSRVAVRTRGLARGDLLTEGGRATGFSYIGERPHIVRIAVGGLTRSLILRRR